MNLQKLTIKLQTHIWDFLFILTCNKILNLVHCRTKLNIFHADEQKHEHNKRGHEQGISKFDSNTHEHASGINCILNFSKKQLQSLYLLLTAIQWSRPNKIT